MKITLQTNQRLFFTSDTHYNHANICSATSKWTDPSRTRKFSSLSYMNDAIVGNINAKVRQDDILFHLGDWSFGGFESIKAFRDRIWCKNIHLITGNHDHHIERNRDNVQDLFSSVHKYLELSVNFSDYGIGSSNADLVLMHFPIASWNNMAKGTIHLHGHVHFDRKHRSQSGKMLDVGVDGNDLMPHELGSIYRQLAWHPIKSLFDNDHHEVVENYKR